MVQRAGLMMMVVFPHGVVHVDDEGHEKKFNLSYKEDGMIELLHER